jgi:hypothetical protein
MTPLEPVAQPSSELIMVTWVRSSKQANPPTGSHSQRLSGKGVGVKVGDGIAVGVPVSGIAGRVAVGGTAVGEGLIDGPKQPIVMSIEPSKNTTRILVVFIKPNSY